MVSNFLDNPGREFIQDYAFLFARLVAVIISSESRRSTLAPANPARS
jgi:hypothetical protein